ncbi:potassium transporter [Hymenopellis radicata]|nr:potassium transporter [Hymenopellis radicata]
MSFALSALETGPTSYRRTAIRLQGVALFRLSFQTLGIIYSDIGTSPLYVLNGIWPAADGVPSQEDVIGGISAIIWSITLIPLIKYVFISLQFATQEGEGGSFALFQGLYPPRSRDHDADRALTGDYDSRPTSPETSSFKSKMRWPLLIWCLFGTALTMADGMFTPAVSVTSAVGGIGVAQPSVESHIVPIAIAFLLVLFFVQQFGTARLATTFSPVAAVWFLLLASTGIYNITTFPGIFRAFDPSRAVMLFVRTKNYDLLAGILLAVTGSEAVFAKSVLAFLSFGILVYPALILAYLGQGARLIADGEAVIQNVFYRSIPGGLNGGLWWVMWLVALLATLLASQAMITATFSLLQQVISMKSLPPLRMLYTSETIQGQIYIPAINWTLMVGTVIIVAVFSDLASLTNAYGFAVTTVMFSTTVLIAVHIRYVKMLPIVVAIGYLVVFGFFDDPHGAWVPLTIGGCIATIMTLWTWAKAKLEEFIQRDEKSHVTIQLGTTQVEGDSDITDESLDLNDSAGSDDLSTYYYVDSSSSKASKLGGVPEKKELARIPTCAVFHKITEGSGVPHSFMGLIRQWPALPEVLIFLSVSIVPIARVPVEDRYIITKVRSIEGFYGATYCIGFRDDFDVKIEDLVEKICECELLMSSDPEKTQDLIEKIRRVAVNTTHIVPHYHVSSRQMQGGFINYLRRYLIEEIYRRLATMFPETENWITSADEIIHVGINAII